MLIVAGGVHNEEMHKIAVIECIAQQAKNEDIVASVCTGAFLLAEAVLLKEK